MSFFHWFKKPISKISPQQAFAADMRNALLNAAKSIRQANKQGAVDKWLAFPITFGSIMGAVRKTYGDYIVDMNSSAGQIVRGVAEGGEAQRAVQNKLNSFMSRLCEAEGDDEATLALMASMLNEHRWNEIIDGRIILPRPDFSSISIEDRAASFIGSFMEGTPTQKTAAMKALIYASEKIAEHMGIKGGFIAPFDINASSTIEQMGTNAQEISTQFSSDGDAQTNLDCVAYAMVAVLCFSRVGRYQNDPSSAEIAKMAAQAYAAAKTAWER